MSDDPAKLQPDYDEDMNPVILTDAGHVATLAALLQANPDLRDPAYAVPLARAANHLAHEQIFRVIDDPQDFTEWYRRTYDAQDPDAPLDGARLTLRDFPLPQLDTIGAPLIRDGVLFYYAVNSQVGTPCRVQIDLTDPPAATPDYDPVPDAADAG